MLLELWNWFGIVFDGLVIFVFSVNELIVGGLVLIMGNFM